MRSISLLALIAVFVLFNAGCHKNPDNNAAKLPEITPPPRRSAAPAGQQTPMPVGVQPVVDSETKSSVVGSPTNSFAAKHDQYMQWLQRFHTGDAAQKQKVLTEINTAHLTERESAELEKLRQLYHVARLR